MRALLLAACILAAAPLSSLVGAPDADWRRARLPPAAREALRGAGYGLQDDGRVLDPKSRLPLSDAELASALARVDLSARRLALERLRLLLDRGTWSGSGRAAADLRTLVDRDLRVIAAYFDGARTPAERAEAASPVLAGDPGPRVALPYFEAPERRLGDALRAAAASRIARDPYGRAEILAPLAGPGGGPGLPPIVVEDLADDAMQYDYRRRALVVDRAFLAASAADGAPARERGALEKTLASRRALIGYLNSHPKSVADFASRNDVLLAHELVHASQDRRDPILREMSRGTLPAAVVIDYEEEAWLRKNLYLRSRLKRDPASVADDAELADFREMTADPTAWLGGLRARYAAAASNALDLETVRSIQQLRLKEARERPVSGRDEQNAKSLDLLALTRADRELAEAAAAQRGRVAALLDEVRRGQDSDRVLLAEYYLRSARNAPNDVEFSVRLQKAEAYAEKSEDRGLLARVRALRGSRR